MTVQQRDRPRRGVDPNFTAVRAALPAENAAAFDAQLETIARAPVLDLNALDNFLSTWWRIATRITADPADWQRVLQEAEEINSGLRSLGPTLAEVLARRRHRR